MNNIKTIRELKKMTQEDLCKLAGVSQSAIAKWETGETNPRADKLPVLAKIFGCTIDELFAEKEKPAE